MMKKKLLKAVMMLSALLAAAAAAAVVALHCYRLCQMRDNVQLVGHIFFVISFVGVCSSWFAWRALNALDISVAERNQQALELKRERDFAANLLNAAPVSILLLDEQGNISYANPCFEQLTGYQLEEIKGKDWFSSFVPEFYREHIRALFNSISCTTVKSSHINPIVTRNGEQREIAWLNQPLYDFNGQLSGVISIGKDVTEQRLREREMERYTAVVRSASDFIGLFSLDGKVQFINQAGRQLLGVSVDGDCSKIPLGGLLAGGRWPLLADIAAEVLATGRWLGEHQFCNLLDGGTIAVSIDLFRIDDPNTGEAINFGLVARDLRPQKVAEERLRLNEARLNEAQRIAKVGSWELDLKTGQLIWTDEVFRLFELDKENFEATYDAFLNIIHPDDREKVNQVYTNSLHSKTPYQIIHRLLMPDGRIKWVEECGDTDFDAEDKPISSWGTVQDITKSQLEVEATLATRIELQAVIDAATEVAIISTDVNGVISLFNKGAERMLGYQALEVVNKQAPVFFHQATEIAARSELLSKRYGQAVEGLPVFFEPSLRGDLSPCEWTYIRKDGSLLPVSQTVTAKHDGQGNVIGFLFVASDLTGHKRAKAALISLNQALEQRVAERTAELVNARDEAQRASHAKSQFLSRMSHELRTPLNAILGFGQLLETDTLAPLVPDQLDSVREILKAGGHLLELINEVLDLARIETGRLELAMEALAIGPLLEECIGSLQPLIMERGITLNFYADCSCTVHADRLRLRQTILNLLANAIKYNRDSGQIWVSCRPEGKDRMRIAFRDTGKGIPAHALPNLFKNFERLESAYSGVEGSGVGLALCKQLIEAMGGSIGVQSKLGEGSIFWVDCVLAEAAATGG